MDVKNTTHPASARTQTLRSRIPSRAIAAMLATMLVAPVSALGQEGEPVKIGGLFHLTGIGQIWGPLQEQPAILAVEEINAAGGVLGRPLELISEDDETDPDVSVQKGTKLALEDEVEAIFGLVYSSTRSAVAANVAARYQVPYFYPTYSEGGVCGRYFVNLGALPNQQLDFFIPYLMERYGPNFYFVGQDYVWPQESIAYSTAAHRIPRWERRRNRIRAHRWNE